PAGRRVRGMAAAAVLLRVRVGRPPAAAVVRLRAPGADVGPPVRAAAVPHLLGGRRAHRTGPAATNGRPGGLRGRTRAARVAVRDGVLHLLTLLRGTQARHGSRVRGPSGGHPGRFEGGRSALEVPRTFSPNGLQLPWFACRT